MFERLAPDSKGLDFWLWSGPTLSLMLEEAGHDVALYDIFFHPNEQALQTEYDFMTATEVIEHFTSPRYVWQQWLNLVKPEAGLVLNDQNGKKDRDAFASWHYKNDPHTCDLLLVAPHSSFG